MADMIRTIARLIDDCANNCHIWVRQHFEFLAIKWQKN